MIGGKQRPTVVEPNGALLRVQNLVKYFPIKGGLLQTTVANVKAVDDVSFEIKQGETLGLIGESSSGKSTDRPHILPPIPPTSGQAILEGRGIVHANKKQRSCNQSAWHIIFHEP